MEKKIWITIGLLVLTTASFGFIIPKLISAKSDLAVLLGVVLTIAIIYFVVKTVIKLIKK